MTLQVAYLVNQYPKGSHTFIRREVLALEALGQPVERVSVRRMTDALDAADQAELDQRAWSVLLSALPCTCSAWPAAPGRRHAAARLLPGGGARCCGAPSSC